MLTVGVQHATALCRPPWWIYALPSGAADQHKCAAAPLGLALHPPMQLCWLLLLQLSPAQLEPASCEHGSLMSPSLTEQPAAFGTPEARPDDRRPAAAGSASCHWPLPADPPAPVGEIGTETGQDTL